MIFGIFVTTAFGLFVIKYRAENINYQLTEIKKQIDDEKHKIHLLKAEIAYLTSPDMLRQFANNNSKMQVIALTQIIPDPLIAGEINNEDRVAAKTSSASSVKWRFKKAPNKYLQQAAMKK